MADSEVLRAPHVLEYPYVRSVGPVIGAFLTGLREGRILGAQSHDAGGAPTVIVPPTEYDPVTSADVGDLVEVGQSGVVTTWSWAAQPKKDQPLDRPFAWALVQLDGATTGMLHVVDAGSAAGHVERDAGHGALAPGRRAPSAACRTSSASCPRGPHHERREHHHRLRRVGRGPRHDPRHPDATRLPVHRRAVAVPLPPGHRPGQVHRPALPGLPPGLRPAPRVVPDRRRRHHRPGRARQHGDGHDLLRRERALPGPVDRDPLHLRPDPPRRGQHRLHGAHPGAPRHRRAHGAAGGSGVAPKDQWGLTMASVKYFRPNGEPDADYETYKEYL